MSAVVCAGIRLLMEWTYPDHVGIPPLQPPWLKIGAAGPGRHASLVHGNSRTSAVHPNAVHPNAVHPNAVHRCV